MIERFTRALAELRREKGVSQRQAAKELGVSQALLSHYENGIREPGLAFVVRACDYYGASADYLLGRTDRRQAPDPGADPLDGGQAASALARAGREVPALGDLLRQAAEELNHHTDGRRPEEEHR